MPTLGEVSAAPAVPTATRCPSRSRQLLIPPVRETADGRAAEDALGGRTNDENACAIGTFTPTGLRPAMIVDAHRRTTTPGRPEVRPRRDRASPHR